MLQRELTQEAVTLRPFRLLDTFNADASLAALAELKGDGLVLLPARVCRTLGLKRGDRVRVTGISGGVRVGPVRW